MSGIAAGSIVHVGGRTVLNRLQDAGLQDPRVPTQTVYETGNDLVVGKILTEADFRFQLTSWDVSTDLMALLTGQYAAALGDQITGSDTDGTVYKWEDCQFINVASPWKGEVGTDGGDVNAGVLIPGLMATGLTYRLGVTDMAQMQATLSNGAYYMSEAYPLEEIALGDGGTRVFVTSEAARVYRIGGSGSTRLQHVFGVLLDGVVQIPGVDYVESGGYTPEGVTTNEGQRITTTGAPSGGSAFVTWPTVPSVEVPWNSSSATLQGLLDGIFGGGNTLVAGGPLPTPLTITFQGDLAGRPVDLPYVDDDALVPAGGGSPPTPHMIVGETTVGEYGAETPITITFAKAPANDAVVKFMYFTAVPHSIPQADNLDTVTLPAAVRGRDIDILVGDPRSSPLVLQGVQSFEMTASRTGRLQREMGLYDPIGFALTGIDTNGTVTVEPRDKDMLFAFLSEATGVDRSEIFGYVNQYTFPLTAVIHNPKNPANIIKCIYTEDAIFQAPGESARVQQVTQFPVRWESENGTFREVKGELPTLA